MELPRFLYTGMPQGINQDIALIILIINVFAPGVGTIILGYSTSGAEAETIYTGIAQLVTSVFGIGFIWAIIWSVRLYKLADIPSANNEEFPLSDVTSPASS